MIAHTTFTDGFDVLHLTGRRSATITSVALEGSDGLKLVGASLAEPERNLGSIQFFDGYPPANGWDPIPGTAVRPAVGARITPDPCGYELLLGLDPTRRGHLHRDGVRIDYTVDGNDYSKVLPSALYICSAASIGARCPLPKKWQ